MKTKTTKRKRGADVTSTDLVRRFSDKQADLAAKLSNDIAEGLDCRESRKTLRMALAYFSDVACVEAQRRAAAESKLEIFRSELNLQVRELKENLSEARRIAEAYRHAYSTIEEYEELVGFKVNESFRTGWMMARTMNSHIAALAESANEKAERP